MITPRENLLRVLRHQKPEWNPCCFHVSNDSNIPGNLPPELLKKPLDRLAISKYLGGDLLYEIYPMRTFFTGNVSVNTNTKNGNTSIREFHTPIGTLYTYRETTIIKGPTPARPLAENTVNAGEFPITTVTRFPIQNKDDYKTLQYLFEHMRFELDHKVIENSLADVGRDGIVVISGGMSSPLYGLIGEYAGLERFVYDFSDYPELLAETMNIMTEKACEWYQIASTAQAHVIRGNEDIDIHLISPELARKYSLPSVKKYANICHSNDKIMLLHMCGHIKEFLADIRTTGVDAIHCLCPPPTGNTPLSYAREILNDKVVMMIRPDPATLVTAMPEKIEESIRLMLNEVSEISGFILIVPCGRAPLDNLLMLKATMQKYRQ